MADTPRSIESCIRVYEVLIRAYPTSFRREYADEMSLVFCEHMTAAWQARGAAGLITAWFRVLGDLARTIPGEHLHEMQRRVKMKTTALAILSVLLAPIVFWVIFAGGMVSIILPIGINSSHSTVERWMFVVLYLSAFLTGLVLSRVKQFVMPAITVPLGIVAVCGIAALSDARARGSLGDGVYWGAVLVVVGFLASVGFASLLGCVVARKAASRLERISVPWFQWVGPLGILICTSAVACVLQLVSIGNQVSPDLLNIFAWCQFALLLIAAITIANLVVLLVQNYRKTGVPCTPVEHVRPIP